MSEITLRIDGREVRVAQATTVASVIARFGVGAFGHHAPVCGMGICYQCRVTIDGTPHRLACQTLCRDAMEVVTG